VENHLRIDASGDEHVSVLAISGELDLASTPQLEEALERVRDADCELLILDLREVTFMDSTGLSVLVKANQRAYDAGRRLAVVKGSPQVQRLLSLTGVGDRLTLIEAPEELLDRDCA
jgi:anti-anti-sigma factor